MKTIITTFAAFTTALALGGTAAAQDARAAELAPDTTYTFGDHDVEGGRETGLGELIESRTLGRRQTLVRPRVHFVPELLESVDAL